MRNKRLVRLTESDLHSIVKESVKRVMREQVIKEGTHVTDYRRRAVNALLDRGVDEQEAREWENMFFSHYLHGANNKIIRLEEFFAAAAAEVGFDDGKVNRLIDILETLKSNGGNGGFYDIGQLRRGGSAYEQLNNLFGNMGY